MLQEQIHDAIRSMSTADLEAIKSMIAKEERNRYDEMWWTHDRIDDYLYKIHYADGNTYVMCKGKQAYERYLKEEDATWIERYTKNLFPTYEFLERKERA